MYLHFAMSTSVSRIIIVTKKAVALCHSLFTWLNLGEKSPVAKPPERTTTVCRTHRQKPVIPKKNCRLCLIFTLKQLVVAAAHSSSPNT